MSADEINSGPLAGLKVLDLSRILAGPTCTQLLGDYGADVVKVEKPDGGDDTRKWGPNYVKDEAGNDTDESAYFLSCNRNKRSIAVDISSKQGAETIAKLATKCDVLVENFKVGGLKKYGLDFESLSKINPMLIYCSITGYGQTGPNANLPGYDVMAQGFGGIMSITGEPDGKPMKVGVAVADVMCGMYASTAILAALRHRDQKREGQHIDIGLVDTQVSWLTNSATNYLVSGKLPVRHGNAHANIVPYQVFEASDGYVIVAVGNDSQFSRFAKILEHGELACDERFSKNSARLENREELIEILDAEISKWSKEALLAAMDTNNVPGGPINNLQEVLDSEQVQARDMRIKVPHSLAKGGEVELIGNPVKFSKSPVSYRNGPPVCGEHSDEILADWIGDNRLG